MSASDSDTSKTDALKQLGVNKKAEDLAELYIIDYTKGSSAAAKDFKNFYLVNTSGKVIDSKSKNKDGNDYYYVINKEGGHGKIVAIYAEN